MLAGKYPLSKGDGINVLIPKLHRDTEVWGDDVEAFRPERFEDPSKIPFHAFKPFGNGQRACIGQQFALQEATLVLGMVLKQFELIDHTNYQLKVKEALTLKPDNFTIRVRTRETQTGYALAAPGNAAQARTGEQAENTAASRIEAHNTPLLVLYGSNLGTAEGIARELADTARYQGFSSEVAPLDSRIGKLPKEGAVFIVSASYNGKPPSNARQFVQWLEDVEPGELEGVAYAVFGCGDHNWASTYQQVPRQIDEQLAAKGAKRLVVRGEADASGDFEKQVEEWGDNLWPDVLSAFRVKTNADARNQERSTLSVQFVSGLVGTPIASSYDAQHATIAGNYELQKEGSGRSTRHLEINLPEGVTYQEGDHIGVIPENAAGWWNVS